MKNNKELTDKELILVERECSDCVKFRGTYCLVLSEFYCLSGTDRKCPAKEVSLFAWKRTLLNMLEYSRERKENLVETSWVVKELKNLEEKMNSEISQCRFEEEHKSIKRGKSEGGRDKTYRHRLKIEKINDYFPDLER